MLRDSIAMRTAYGYFLAIPTRWKDNDVYGHVNNVEYYSFFDTVINRFLIADGGLDIHRGDVIGLCVESHCTFKRPLAFPGDVDAGLRVAQLGRTPACATRSACSARARRSRRRRAGSCTCSSIARSAVAGAAGARARGLERLRSRRQHGMRVRAAVLREMGLPRPYAESRPLAIEEVELAPPGPGDPRPRPRGRPLPLRPVGDRRLAPAGACRWCSATRPPARWSSRRRGRRLRAGRPRRRSRSSRPAATAALRRRPRRRCASRARPRTPPAPCSAARDG